MLRLATPHLLRTLAWIVAATLAAHLLISLLLGAAEPSWPLGLVQRFVHPDQERAFPTYLASMLLSLCALVAFWISRLERLPAPGWRGVALVFWLAGIDEIAAVHEEFSPPVRHALELGTSGFGWLRFAWVIPAALLLLVLLALFLRFIAALAPRTRGRLLRAALVFLSGSLLLELPGGLFSLRYGLESVPYLIVSTLEEGLEFAGVLLFLSALLAHLRALAAPPTLQLEGIDPHG